MNKSTRCKLIDIGFSISKLLFFICLIYFIATTAVLNIYLLVQWSKEQASIHAWITVGIFCFGSIYYCFLDLKKQKLKEEENV